MEEFWSIVSRIVKARGRNVRKYSFFEDVWKALDLSVGLVIVRAPTGCGKTEAVTAKFLRGLEIECRPWLSMIYVLPTRSLAFAMRRRLSRSVEALGVSWCTVTLDYGEFGLLKPYLEGDIVVTTYDTLLYQFYGIVRPGYNVLLPMSKVSNSLVIMDEIQLLQDEYWYSLSLIPYHVSSLLELGARVIILSATLPEVLINDISCMLSRAIHKYRIRDIWEESLKIIDSRDEALRGALDVELVEGELPSDERLLSILRDYSFEENLPGLIVVNKVEKAAEIYKTLINLKKEGKLGDAVPLLLHSRLRRGARREIEDLFEKRGDGSEEISKRILLVATQVVEAGLDLNVKLLLTDVSPVDSLIQRLGRCGRKESGRAVVFVSEEAGKKVYPLRLLRRTVEEIHGMEKELSLSVKLLKVAQELVDRVFTREEVEYLKKNVENLVIRVGKWIQNLPLNLFSRKGHETSSPLLRLGYELKCWLPSMDHYNKLTKENFLKVSFDEFKDNLVRLSLRKLEKPIPAIVHTLGEHKVLYELKLDFRENVEINVIERNLASFSSLVSKGSFFLLNPIYYEEWNGAELGVVSPWKEK